MDPQPVENNLISARLKLDIMPYLKFFRSKTMIKKTILTLTFCTFLCFMQPKVNACTKVTTTTRHYNSYFEILSNSIDSKLGISVAVGCMIIVGFFAFIAEETKRNKSHSKWS